MSILVRKFKNGDQLVMTISTASLVDYHFYSINSWLPIFDIKALVDSLIWISEPNFSKDPSIWQLILTMSPESWILACFNFVYILYVLRPSGIETKVFQHTQPLKVIHRLSFWLKRQDLLIWYVLGKRHCWHQFWPQSPKIGLPGLNLGWGRC